jgi:hypothetical protein
MTDHKNIQEAMLAIYKSVGYVQKTKSENLNYKFASETGFIQEIRPAMVENGVTVSVSKMDNLTQESYTTKSGAVMMRSTIHGVVTFSHVSGSSISVESYGEGSDSGDKSVNKAMTDLYKYALRQTFMIETGDDPDKDASEPAVKQANTPEKKTESKPVEVPDKVTNQDYYTLTRVKMHMSVEDANDFLAAHDGSFEKAFLAAKAQMESK